MYKNPTDHTQPTRGQSSLQTGDQIAMLYLAWLFSLSRYKCQHKIWKQFSESYLDPLTGTLRANLGKRYCNPATLHNQHCMVCQGRCSQLFKKCQLLYLKPKSWFNNPYFPSGTQSVCSTLNPVQCGLSMLIPPPFWYLSCLLDSISSHQCWVLL